MMTPAAYGLLALVSMASVFGGYFGWQAYQRQIGAQQYQVRVERAEKKVDAKIEKAQRAISKLPPGSVLDRWSRP